VKIINKKNIIINLNRIGISGYFKFNIDTKFNIQNVREETLITDIIQNILQFIWTLYSSIYYLLYYYYLFIYLITINNLLSLILIFAISLP
jgi:hypothetical protein